MITEWMAEQALGSETDYIAFQQEKKTLIATEVWRLMSL